MRAHSVVLIMAAAIAVAGLAAPAAAQQAAATAADFQRLQDNINATGPDLAQLRARDAKAADQIQADLDLLRDEVAYLRVKQRRENNVTRAEFLDLLDRIDILRARARGDRALTTAREGVPRDTIPRETSPALRPGEIPVGTELDVRIQTPLSSATAQVEDSFDATTVVDLSLGDHVLIPSGSTLRGVVKAVDKASRIDRKGSLNLGFSHITVRGVKYPVRATVTEALEGEGIRSDAGRIGGGAGVGAIIGGILGGLRGALAGILIGGGGAVIATPGKDVNLAVGTILRIRFDEPLLVK